MHFLTVTIMTTKRARQHKEDTFFDALDRKNNKINNRGGLFNKFLKEVECRPYKFRKRAYYRENDLEGKILETEPLGLLRFVNPPAGWQQWSEEKHEH